jgi:hypothetical protein
MIIVHAIILMLMPSMMLLAVLLCKPAFRRGRKSKRAVALHPQVSKGGTYKSYASFSHIGTVDRSHAVKGGRDRAAIRSR